jgi:hypothetical protein
MIIKHVVANANGTLTVVRDDGISGIFSVQPYFECEAFEPLRQPEEFMKVRSHRYFVEWACGADLSADTIEAHALWSTSEPEAS